MGNVFYSSLHLLDIDAPPIWILKARVAHLWKYLHFLTFPELCPPRAVASSPLYRNCWSKKTLEYTRSHNDVVEDHDLLQSYNSSR